MEPLKTNFSEGFVRMANRSRKYRETGNLCQAVATIEEQLQAEANWNENCNYAGNWILKNNLLCCQFEKNVYTKECEQSQKIIHDQLKEVLEEEQGIPASQEMLPLELTSLSNLIAIKASLMILNSIRTCEEILLLTTMSLERAKTVMFNHTSSEKENLSTGHHKSILNCLKLLNNLIKKMTESTVHHPDQHYLLLQAFSVLEVNLTLLLVRLRDEKVDTELKLILSSTLEFITREKIPEESQKGLMCFSLGVHSSCEIKTQLSLLNLLLTVIHQEHNPAGTCMPEQVAGDLQSYSSLYTLIKALQKLACNNYQQSYELICTVINAEEQNILADKVIQSIARNVLGICLCMTGKPAAALLSFKTAIGCLKSNRASILNTVTVLKILKQNNACVESLQYLINLNQLNSEQKVNHMLFGFKESFMEIVCNHYLKDNHSIMKSVVPEGKLIVYAEELNERELLFLLAEAFFEICKFTEAADAYLNLIGIICRPDSTNGLEDKQAYSMSSSLNMYHKCVLSTIHSNRFEDAIVICDRVLSIGVIVVAEVTEVSVEEGMKSLCDTAVQGDHQEKCSIVLLNEDVITLLYKAEALRQLKKYADAAECFKQVLSVISSAEQSLVDDKEPLAKRRRISACQNTDPYPRIGNLSFMKCQYYNNFSVLLFSMKQKDAFIALKNAIKCQPKDIPFQVKYNYCKWLWDQKMYAVSLQNWNESFSASESEHSLKEILSEPFKVILDSRL